MCAGTISVDGWDHLCDNFCGRLGPFMRAHSKLTESGDISFYSQSTVDVSQRAFRKSSEDSNGERENNALSKALQTKEQRDCVRCFFSKMIWNAYDLNIILYFASHNKLRATYAASMSA
jgi:hypothetical protein